MNLIRNWKSRSSDDKYLHSLYKKVKNLPKAKSQLAQQIHEEVFSELDCLECANCCKSIPPMLSNRDIKRISKALRISVSEFRQKYTVIDEDGDTVINASPCPFLEADNKCRIYRDRPSACRLYPHSGDQVFFKNMSHHKRNMKYCPGLLEILRRLSEA